MKILYTALALALAIALTLVSCATNPETGERGLSLPAIRQELHMIRGDLEAAATILADTPEQREKLAEVIAAADQVAASLDAWIATRDPEDHAGLIESVDLALALASDLVDLYAGDERDVTSLRLGLFAADVVLRRIMMYSEGPSSTGDL